MARARTTGQDNRTPAEVAVGLPDLKAGFLLANPLFNISDWVSERLAVDTRWQCSAPLEGNADLAWVQSK